MLPDDVRFIASGETLVRGIGTLLVLELIAGVLSWLVLRFTTRAPRLRAVLLFALWVAGFAAIFPAISQRDAWYMSVVFVWIYGAFLCRFLSSTWHFGRSGKVPGVVFHVVLLIWGPRQHYGADDWSDLKGRKMSPALLKEWGVHVAYEAAVIVLVLLITWAWLAAGLPFREVVLPVAAFWVGLEAIEFLVNLQFLTWSFWGKFPGFFGRFAMFRSRHIGEWWQRWNVPAINLFRELSGVINLRLPRLWNVMIVFFVSGVLHQIVVYYYTRGPSYGAMLSFILHGAFVYVFGELYVRRKKLPAPLRLLIFNPVTSAAVVIAAGLPFILDFTGWFLLR